MKRKKNKRESCFEDGQKIFKVVDFVFGFFLLYLTNKKISLLTCYCLFVLGEIWAYGLPDA